LCGVATFVLLALGSAGCGFDDSAEVEAEAGRCTTPGVSADEVKVGLVYPNLGTFAETFGPFRAGVDARFGLANADGGVNGRNVTYEWADDEGVATKNLTVSQDLVEREGVFALLQASTASSGSAQYLADRRIPVVGIAAQPAWYEHRNMFSSTYVFTDGDSVDTFGRYAREQGGTRALIIGFQERNQPGGGVSGQLAASLTAAGIEVDPASPVEFTPGSSSADRLAEQVLAKGVDT
nr:ABC transporter substrate-binding protein [Micromonospora sp. DSM 115978]